MGDLMEPDVKKAISDLESLKALAEGGDRVEAADIEAVINILNPPKPPPQKSQTTTTKATGRPKTPRSTFWSTT